MTKQAKVEVRCTDEEKARWQEAAGGPRRVSAWLRDLANATAERHENPLLVVEANEPLLHEPVVEATKTALIPDPSADALGRGKVREKKRTGCVRSHFHRPGVYCGTCKKIN